MTEKTENKEVQKDDKTADEATATEQNEVATDQNPTEEAKEESKEDPKEEVKEEAKQEEVAETPEAPEAKAEEEPKEEAKEEPAKAEANEEKEEKNTKKPAAKKASKPEPSPGPEGAHDDFDWEQSEDPSAYSKEEQKTLSDMYEGSFNEITENQLITATVVSLTAADAVLDVGFKSDGLVSLSEFRDMPDMKAGDEVEVYVAAKEDVKGQLVLSRKNAKLMRAWDQIVDAYGNDKVVTGDIVSKTKGGLIANVFGLETFLPGSQIDVKPILDYDSFVGKTMEFKVVKINEAIKNAVVSHKALIESDLEAQRNEIISKLEKGQVLEGVIKNITDFGAFIDLGGVDGLLYITDISWGRISHPSEVLKLNQKLNVVVLDFDDEKKRISLGLKQLTKHPWDELGEELAVGSKIKGKIVNIEDYGAFLEITPGVEGLIHVSEVSWSNQMINPKEFFNLGDEHEAIVVTLDREERKMSLSIKQLTKDPWDDIAKKYEDGTQHKGLVKNITPFGVFVELEEGIGGMVHISDLSWTKKFHHPNEFTSVGETLDLVVLEIDIENRKLSLGHKQLEENPWETFEQTFPVGSVHKATVLKRDEKGGVVLLPYGLEAYAPGKHLRTEDNHDVAVDDQLEVMIIEFDANSKRVIVSHSKTWEKGGDDKPEPSSSGEQKKKPARSKKPSNKGLKNVQDKLEKTTLGDLDALANLKEQLDEAEGKGGDAPAAEEAPEAPEASEEASDDAGEEK